MLCQIDELNESALSIFTLCMCFAPALILAQSNSSKAWTAWTLKYEQSHCSSREIARPRGEQCAGELRHGLCGPRDQIGPSGGASTRTTGANMLANCCDFRTEDCLAGLGFRHRRDSTIDRGGEPGLGRSSPADTINPGRFVFS